MHGSGDRSFTPSSFGNTFGARILFIRNEGRKTDLSPGKLLHRPFPFPSARFGRRKLGSKGNYGRRYEGTIEIRSLHPPFQKKERMAFMLSFLSDYRIALRKRALLGGLLFCLNIIFQVGRALSQVDVMTSPIPSKIRKNARVAQKRETLASQDRFEGQTFLPAPRRAQSDLCDCELNDLESRYRP